MAGTTGNSGAAEVVGNVEASEVSKSFTVPLSEYPQTCWNTRGYTTFSERDFSPNLG